MKRRTELLMPAGSLEKLRVTLLYGANAVYIGTPDMSLRTCSEFSMEDMLEGVTFAHSLGKRVYLTLNIYSHNKDIEKLPTFLDTIRTVNPDGVIIADPAIFQFVKKYAPELELHVSTQANVCSWAGVNFWKEQGASLCVLAREVTFSELTKIRGKCPDIKLETFVHGSMCMAHSGRCLLSNFMAERGANQGNCANTCRWNYKVKYALEEEYRPKEYYDVFEDDHGAYIMNSRDLCLMPVLDQYLKLGIDSLKVEGRNKSLYYLAVITRAYRAAIDSWNHDPAAWRPELFVQEIETVPSRGYTLAFHHGRLTNFAHNYTFNRSLSDWLFAGYIVAWEKEACIIEVKNRLQAGDVLEFILPGSLDVIRLRLYEFIEEKTGELKDVIHAGQKPRIRIPLSAFDQENTQKLKNRMPILTAIRKERELTYSEWRQARANKLSYRFEAGEGTIEALENAKEKAPNIPAKESGKSPKIGLKACCSRGCNGCLKFWNDPAYKKAREKIKGKKTGERLSKNEVNSI